jgi:hypothetical protein
MLTAGLIVRAGFCVGHLVNRGARQYASALFRVLALFRVFALSSLLGLCGQPDLDQPADGSRNVRTRAAEITALSPDIRTPRLRSCSANQALTQLPRIIVRSACLPVLGPTWLALQ